MAKNAHSANSILAEKHATSYGDDFNRHDQKHEQQNHENDHKYEHDKKKELPFYPVFCFPASPTHFTWVKMSIADIHRLRTRRGFEGQNIFFYNNHPIQFVCLAGYIVSREEYERRTVLTVDDSSGSLIEVVVLKAAVQDDKNDSSTTTATTSTNTGAGASAGATTEMTTVTSTTRTPIDISPLRLGTAVKIKGTLSFKYYSASESILQVILERFFLLADTTAETTFWSERSRFLIDILSEPWYLSPAEIESLRQQARKEEDNNQIERRKTQERKRRNEERESKYQRRIVRRWEAEEKLREKECERVRESNKRLERWLIARRQAQSPS